MTDDEARKSIAAYVRRYCGGKRRRGGDRKTGKNQTDKMSVREAVENISKKIGVVPRTVERMLAEGGGNKKQTAKMAVREALENISKKIGVVPRSLASQTILGNVAL